MITWTIGAGGLLGSAVQRLNPNAFQAATIPWADTECAKQALDANVREFQRQCADQDWAIVWAAGNAATASAKEQTDLELQTFTALVDSLGKFTPDGRGAFFLASSAGGVYAGAQQPPFNVATPTQPLSAYGELKLAQEQAAIENLRDVCPVVIGRISNLYGPGQNLNKLQGLISRLALAAISKQAINMFVSLDTMRDYIYSDDAAAVVMHWVNEAVTNQPEQHTVKIIASGHPVSLGSLIHLMQDIGRTKIPIAFGAHNSASSQALDLRLVPTHDVETERLIQTTLAAGTKNVYLDILKRFQQATTAL